MKNTFQAIKEVEFGIKYNYKATRASIKTPRAKKIYEKALSLFKEGKKEKAMESVRQLNNLFGQVVSFDHNIVPTLGLTQLAKGLSGNLGGTTGLEIKYGAVGSGTGTPALGDTTLGTEQYRKADSSLTYALGKAYVTMFYTATDFTTTGAIGNLKEHGLFIMGTTGADSGTLWSRVLLNAPTGTAKTSLETLTIDYEVEFTNA